MQQGTLAVVDGKQTGHMPEKAIEALLDSVDAEIQTREEVNKVLLSAELRKRAMANLKAKFLLSGLCQRNWLADWRWRQSTSRRLSRLPKSSGCGSADRH